MQSLTSDDLYVIVWTDSLVRIISTICDRLFFVLPPGGRFFYFSRLKNTSCGDLSASALLSLPCGALRRSFPRFPRRGAARR